MALNNLMTNWSAIQRQGQLYGTCSKRQSHSPKLQQRLAGYKVRMRRRPTRAERRFKKVLRQALQGSNYKVVTQRMFVNTKAAKQKGYIVDFYIPVLKLAIEIDGSSHDSKQAGKYDVVRTSFLAYRGVKVLRFTNEETHQQDHCITRLQEAISDREKTMLDRQRVYQDAPVKPCISRQDEVDLQTAFIAERGVTLCKSK